MPHVRVGFFARSHNTFEIQKTFAQRYLGKQKALLIFLRHVLKVRGDRVRSQRLDDGMRILQQGEVVAGIEVHPHVFAGNPLENREHLVDAPIFMILQRQLHTVFLGNWLGPRALPTAFAERRPPQPN